MNEIIFLIEEDPEGGYVARAIGESIFTQADTIEALKEFMRDAIHCHFPNESDRQIDQLVYELYELTEAEIAVPAELRFALNVEGK